MTKSSYIIIAISVKKKTHKLITIPESLNK